MTVGEQYRDRSSDLYPTVLLTVTRLSRGLDGMMGRLLMLALGRFGEERWSTSIIGLRKRWLREPTTIAESLSHQQRMISRVVPRIYYVIQPYTSESEHCRGEAVARGCWG